MLIELENQVVIFDEAHNMEDAARDAASFAVTTSQFLDVEEELDDIGKSQRERGRIACIHRHMLCLSGMATHCWLMTTIQ